LSGVGVAVYGQRDVVGWVVVFVLFWPWLFSIQFRPAVSSLRLRLENRENIFRGK
jgi:hypothetical protein